MPEEPEGYMVYMSSLGGGPNTMTAQNTRVIDIDEPSWIIDEDWVEGSAPRTPLTAAKIGAPPQPDLVALPPAGTGFAQGTYQLSYTWVELNYNGTMNHTPLAPFRSVVLVSTGQRIRLSLPTSAPADIYGIGIWQTPANNASSEARLQEVIPVNDMLLNPIKNLMGPFVWGRTSPNRNETIPPRPLKPLVRHERGNSDGVQGSYIIQLAFVTDQGTESERSEKVTTNIDGEQAKKNHHILVEPQDAPIEGIVGYRVYVQRRAKGEEDYRQLVYANLSKGGAGRPVGLYEKVLFSGTAAWAGIHSDPKVSRVLSGWGGAEQSEDSTVTAIEDGLPVPDTFFESAIATGADLLDTPGTYYVAISYWVRGEETVICTPKPITLDAGWTIQVYFKDKVNLLRNSQFNQIQPSGAPYGWELTGVSGGVNSGTYVMSNGTIRLSTNGPKTGTQTTPVLGGFFVPDRTKVYTIGGTYITEWIAGTMDAYLYEYNSAGTLLRQTPLKSINDNGEVDFERRFGPNNVYTDSTPFLDTTTTCKLYIFFQGATRNGTITVRELYVHDHPNRIRRFEKTDDLLAADNPDPPPSVRWRQARNKVIAPAPSSRRRGAAFTPLATVDFGEGTASTNPPTGWTLRNSNSSGTVAEVRADAAVDGAYGYRIAKTVAETRYTYLHRTFAPTTRNRLGIRAKFRVNQLPTRTGAAQIILSIHNAGPADTYATAIAYIQLFGNGILQLVMRDIFGGFYPYYLATGITNGTVLDIELILRDSHSTVTYVTAAVGRNGTTRTFIPWWGWFDQSAWNPTTVQVGNTWLSDPAALSNIDIDSIVVTETGDSLVAPGATPAGEALPKPDAPLAGAIPIGSEINFNDGTFPSSAGWTQLRTPADGTTTLAVQTASSIDDTQPVGQRYGIRFADTGTATTAQVAMQKSVTADVTDTGNIAVRCRFRIVTRPTSGNVRVLGIRDAANNTLAYAYLDSTGTLYARAASTGTGTTPPDVILARNLVNTNLVTVELVLSDTGTIAGTLNAWCSVGGTGTKAERKLMGQPQGVDWSGGKADKVLAGIVTESIASVTSSFDFDNILLTETGEMNYRLYTDANEPINQAYCFYPKDQEKRNDLWAKNARIAVKPGRTYTLGVWARHSDVPVVSWPFTIHAYDLSGIARPLGSLYDSVGGAIGTAAWQLYTKEIVVPKAGNVAPNGEIYEADCHEIRVSSPGVGAGEYVCQEFCVSPGHVAQSEVVYPIEGTVWITLDSEIPSPAPEPLANNSSTENLWLRYTSIVDQPDGTTVDYEYATTQELEEPTTWYTTEEAALDNASRFAHMRLTFGSDSSRRLTPRLNTGSPWLEYATILAGIQHIPKLLRANGTEFPGGAYISQVKFPTNRGEYDVRRIRGRTKRHRRTEPVTRIGAYTLRVHSEAAMAEITNTCLEEEFLIEVHNRRMLAIFVEEVEFDFVDEAPGILAPATGTGAGNHYAVMEASVSEMEVYEIHQMTSIYERLGIV